VTFRRSRQITKEAENGLKWIAIVARYAGGVRHAAPHSDASVRSEAEKLIRALRSRRITWDQLAHGLKQVRSLVRTRGRQRAKDTAVRDPLTITAPGGYIWREIVTTRELAAVGLANGWCTHEPEYQKQLKARAVRFFVLESADGDETLALISLQPRSRTVEGARAPYNEPIPLAHREAVQALLDRFGITGDSDDLLAIGLTTAVPDVDLYKADLAIGEVSVWFGPIDESVEEDDLAELGEDEEVLNQVVRPKAMLIRVGTSFALLRPVSRQMTDPRFCLQQSHGAKFDGDDLLGRLLTGMSGRA
jgi:hypothetical protein